MREPNRIDEFCRELSITWKNSPDLRFGQLIHILQKVAGNDLFYYEDEDMINLLKEYRFEQNKNNYATYISETYNIPSSQSSCYIRNEFGYGKDFCSICGSKNDCRRICELEKNTIKRY